MTNPVLETFAYADALTQAKAGKKIRCAGHQVGWLIEWSAAANSLILLNPFNSRTYDYMPTAGEQGLKWQVI